MLSLLRERFFSFTLVVCVGFLLIVSLLVNASLAAAGRFLDRWMPMPEPVLQIGSSVVSFLVITLVVRHHLQGASRPAN